MCVSHTPCSAQEGDVVVTCHATGEKAVVHFNPYSKAKERYRELHGNVFDEKGEVYYHSPPPSLSYTHTHTHTTPVARRQAVYSCCRVCVCVDFILRAGVF